MPRYASPAALKLLNQPTGTEPFIVVAINWNLAPAPTYYTTRAMPGASNNLMSVSSIRNERRSDSMCNVGSCSLKMSDTDGQMKYIVDNIQIENSPASIFLAFNNTAKSDWIQLLTGRIVGPIVWDERERLLDLNIETLVHSHEIGYAADYGSFNDLNIQAAGVPWPMIFGKCAHVPSLMVRRHAVAHLQVELRFWMKAIFQLVNNNQDIVMLGNPDTYAYLNTPPVKNVLYVDDAHEFPMNKTTSIIIEDIVFIGKFVNNNKFVISQSNAPKYTQIPVAARVGNDPDVTNLTVLWLGKNIPLANHHCYFVAPGGKEWYNYCVRQEGLKCWFRFPFKDPNPPFTPMIMAAGKMISEAYAISKCGIRDDIAGDATFMKDACAFRKKNVGANNFGSLMARFAKIANDGASWWQIPMDSEVRTWNLPDPDIYIASLSPLTEIKAVWGKRRVQVNGKSRTIMCQIPQSYYTISTATYNINGLRATGILFFRPLCEYDDQQWTDDVLVTATGAIGPNTVDIIQWMVKNYTDLFVDQTMAQIAHTHVASHPANFTLFDKRDALKLAQEIAFQSKCALLLDNGGLGIVYLPIEPSQSWNFDENQIKNLQLHYTERKDITTKFVATYTISYRDKHHLATTHEMNIRRFERVLRSLLPTDTRSRSETQMYVYTNNIDRYGLHTREEAAYIYNDYDSVKSFSTFWGFRFSNSWRLVKFETFLQGVRLQVFDGVVMSLFDSTLLNTTLVMGVVDSVEYNPETYTTTMLVWLPIVAGGFFMEPGFWPDTSSGTQTGYWNPNPNQSD